MEDEKKESDGDAEEDDVDHSSKEMGGPPSTGYANIVTPRGFMPPSLPSQPQPIADDDGNEGSHDDGDYDGGCDDGGHDGGDDGGDGGCDGGGDGGD